MLVHNDESGTNIQQLHVQTTLIRDSRIVHSCHFIVVWTRESWIILCNSFDGVLSDFYNMYPYPSCFISFLLRAKIFRNFIKQ